MTAWPTRREGRASPFFPIERIPWARRYSLSMVLSVEAQREWLRQWESAGPALAEQRKKELRELSESRALAATEALLSLVTTAPLDPSRRNYSGLVEQQELFHRRAGK